MTISKHLNDEIENKYKIQRQKNTFTLKYWKFLSYWNTQAQLNQVIAIIYMYVYNSNYLSWACVFELSITKGERLRI